MTRERLAILFGILVPCVWVLAMGIGAITHDYTLVQFITPIVFAEAGWLFGEGVIRVLKNGGPKNGGG